MIFVKRICRTSIGGQIYVSFATIPWTSLIRPVLHIDSKASLTQLLTLYLEQHEIASLVDDNQGAMCGWITMDDVMKVLMGARI